MPLLKTGKWESYSGAKFTIVKARLAQKFLSRSNRTMAITEEGYWLKMHLAKKIKPIAVAFIHNHTDALDLMETLQKHKQ